MATTTSWTQEQVMALAPDASSLKNGQTLAQAVKWQHLGITEQAIWGECQGSSKSPYQAQIDLHEPAFKCTCPSRKFPCKHGLGLLLLYIEQPNIFQERITPPWVTEWLFKRSQADTKKAAKHSAAPDPKTKTQRQEKREQKIIAGLQELDRWLQDLIARGLADLPTQPYEFWDNMAARMVDAQAPGLARRLREAASIANRGGSQWVATLLTELSKIHLLLRGYQRLGELPLGLQAEVRTQIGWSIAQEELVATATDESADSVTGNWLVLGQTVTKEEGNLRAQRIWLWGTERYAMILNFAYGQTPLDITWQSGGWVAAKVIFYPSSAPLRAIVVDRITAEPAHSIDADAHLRLALDRYYQALQQNPWLEIFPLFVENVTPFYENTAWWLVDIENHQLSLQIPDHKGWQLLALSGGQPIALAGLWNGQQLQPLGIWIHDTYQSLGE